MNGAVPKSLTKFIVACIMVLGILSILCGSFLVWKGYQAGELLISGGGVGAISGLLGMVGPRPPPPPPPSTDSPNPITPPEPPTNASI